MTKTERKKGKALPLFMIVLAGMVQLASCTDETFEKAEMDIRKDDGKSILVQVSGENPDADTRTSYNLAAWHTEFADGDRIGVFAYDGTTVIASNVRFTFDGTDWNGDLRIPYNEDYTYYAYYPYAGTTGNPPYTVAASGTVDERFADFIADSGNTFNYADQSIPANFAGSDYMHAQGMDAGSRLITFTMTHKKALAVLCKTVNRWYDTSDPLTPHDTYVPFSGNFPLEVGDRWYFLCKDGVATTIGGTSFTGQAGRYMIKDPNVITETPALTYSVSADGGSTWGSFGSSAPEWLTITPDIMEGEPTDFNVTISTSVASSTLIATETETPVNEQLRQNEKVTGYRDLSMYYNDGEYRGTRTTANCYLVHAPGTYKLPLVYGNAIEKGLVNSSAYHTDAIGTYIKNDLVGHDDLKIDSPYIILNGQAEGHDFTVDDAVLLWQDEEGVITDVSLDKATDNGYLKFEVSEENIKQCNALVAVRQVDDTDPGNPVYTILWSWHIWITPETLSRTTSVSTGDHTYLVTNVNVGWKAPAETYRTYKGYRCKVRATGTGGTVEFVVTQPDVRVLSATDTGQNTYYQWGRKDPFIPSNGKANTNATVYGLSGTVTGYTYSNTRVSPGTSVSNPQVFYNNSNTWNSESYYNDWDINQNTTGDNVNDPTVKTIYDPCPPGYCVPTGGLYKYIVNNYSSYFPWDNKKRTWTKDTPNILFPAAGYRGNSSGSLSYVGSFGYYWSATANSGTYGRYLNFNSSSVDWNNYNRSNGFPVRAVLEEYN